MFAPLEGDLLTVFALTAFHTQYDFLCSFRLKFEKQIVTTFLTQSKYTLYLLPEDGLRLTTKTLLFTVITPSTLRSVTFLGFLVLRYFVQLVNLALLAEGPPLLRNVHLKITKKPCWNIDILHNLTLLTKYFYHIKYSETNAVITRI